MMIEKTKVGCSYYTIFIVESQYGFLHKKAVSAAKEQPKRFFF